MPMGSRPLDQSQSIAWLVTRTQPCEAGNGGTSGNPCTATPPVKYFGRYSTPSGPGPYRPSGVPSQYPRPASRCCTARTSGPLAPGRSRSGRGDADGLGTGGLDPDGEAGRLDPDGEVGAAAADGTGEVTDGAGAGA